MYIKIMLTLLVVALGTVAIQLARTPFPAPRSQELPCPAEVQLAQRIPELKLKSATRQEAVEVLRKKTGALIDVKSKLLAREGKVDMDLRDVTLAGALAAIFNDVDRVVVNARGNVIEIGEFDTIASDLTLRVYDVSDLLSDEYWGVRASPPDAEKAQEARLARIEETIHQRKLPKTS